MAKPCPDCKESRDPSTGKFIYGSKTTGYISSRTMELAKKLHQQKYPDAYPNPNAKPATPSKWFTSPIPKKNGGPITALDQVQRMYSKKKK